MSTNNGFNPGLKITGVGSALPPEVLTNHDLTKLMDTSDEWIKERTGISERRIGGTTLGLAVEAAEAAIKDAGIDKQSIEQIILATTTPENLCPGTSPAIAREIGITCGAFDIQAACSGWVYGLVVANGLLLQGAKNVLLIGSEALDKITDYSDRGTGILFGNGAGAAVLEADTTGQGQLLAWDMDSNGNYQDILYAKHGEKWSMDGREVFRQAVTVIQKSANKVMAEAGIKPEDVALVVPHQANIRIVELAWKKLGFTMEQTSMVLEHTGNTSAASIPLALDAAVKDNQVKNGDIVLFVGFGAGMTWASALVKWNGA